MTRKVESFKRFSFFSCGLTKSFSFLSSLLQDASGGKVMVSQPKLRIMQKYPANPPSTQQKLSDGIAFMEHPLGRLKFYWTQFLSTGGRDNIH
ncbi:CLUMA_CG001762, isoform A [Clunio marinus]|uniref:CLUMA_CG001762, isoform A n=1 Tax=Clunio marinus TaxID=568069 RepID=A0A1J1HIU8_9DIPT|nr:CLUMA_CG001762, isoform A [Clunio marinus]